MSSAKDALRHNENGEVVTACCEAELRRHAMGNWLCSDCGREIRV